MKKISVALLNYNGKKHLETFLPSVIMYSDHPDVEICLIDNASTDDSLTYVQDNFPKVKIIRLDENYGFAEGYNRGLEQIKATYYVLLNTDVEVTENWWMPAIHFLDINEDVAACQPKVLSYREKSFFEHAGAAGGFIDMYGYPFCRGRIIESIEEDFSQYDSIADVFWATGACLFIRSEKFHAVGGFDGTFFAHMEEIDLCWRLKTRGSRIACVPQSMVYHLGGGTLGKEDPHKTYLNYRNNLLMLYKNLPDGRLKKVLFVRCVLDNLSMLVMFFSGEFKNAKAVLKARRDFKKTKLNYYSKRKENLEEAIHFTFPEMLQKSLIFNYYLLGKNTYNKLVNNTDNDELPTE